jgi:hypothetical protein
MRLASEPPNASLARGERRNASHAIPSRARESLEGSMGSDDKSNEEFLEVMKELSIDRGDEPYRKYFLLLGQFVHEFAQVEGSLLVLLRKTMKSPIEVSSVLLSGVRVDAAKEHINAILAAREDHVTKDKLSRPFAQLATINTIRNHILHWGVTVLDIPGFLISNERFNPKKGKEKSFYVKPKDLEDMIHDLRIIHAFLLREQFPFLFDDPELTSVFQESWRYTPPQPSPRAS